MGILGEDDMVKKHMENEEPRPAQVPQIVVFGIEDWARVKQNG
jgi:hypothetical protein